MSVRDLARDLSTLLFLPQVELEVGDGAEREQVFERFNSVHPRYRVIRLKTVGACLLSLKRFSSFEAYLQSVNGKNSPAYYRRKALKLGYRFQRIDRNAYLQDIYEINTSKTERQGKPMGAEYQKYVDHYQDQPHWSYYGVIGPDRRLRAYLEVHHLNDVSYVGPVLGHGEFLNDGIMYMIFLDAIRELYECGAKHFMYDMFFGAPEGLRKFKMKLGFTPHRVRWRRGTA